MMHRHHLDVQISVQLIQMYPHPREQELCFRVFRRFTPLHHISPDLERASCMTVSYLFGHHIGFVFSYGCHWWVSSHYTLTYVQVTALQITFKPRIQ